MAGLLVSVRSAEEAQAVLDGGAAIVDVKEPRRGPLGPADARVWREIVELIDGRVPVSVALGELGEFDAGPFALPLRGVRWGKLGLAGQARNPGWRRRWAETRSAWTEPAWIAVVYADAAAAEAPAPREVVAEAIASGCAGVLFDTWDKRSRSPIEASPSWHGLVDSLREAGLVVVLAGRLDARAIARLAPLRPDYYAVRGAACHHEERDGLIDRERVERLVGAAASA